MKKILTLALMGVVAAAASAQKPKLETFYEGRKWGLRDRNGKVVAPAKYDFIYNFFDGLAAMSEEGEDGKIRWGFIDTTGVEVVEPRYFNVKPFSEGWAAVEGTWEEDTSKRRWGFIDATGVEVIKPQYKYVDYPAEGLIAVSGEGGYGYIDKTGEVIIPLMYYGAGSFNNGVARVSLGSGLTFYIDKTGTPESAKEPLISYIQQVVAYKSRHSSRSSRDFQIAGRYLVIRLRDDIRTTYLDINYPDQKRATKSLAESITDDVNTLVFHYMYRGRTRTYYNRTWSYKPRPVNVTSYGSHLIFFDLRTGKVTGHENLRPPKFASGYSVGDLSDTYIMNNYLEIKQKIESHLTSAEQ